MSLTNLELNLEKLSKYIVDPSILTEENIEKFMGDDDNSDWIQSLKSDKYTTLAFNLGFVTFKIDKDKCFIMGYFRDRGSSNEKKDNIWEAFQDMLKDNGCKKVSMVTSINPKMWKKRYGFDVKRYEMEKIL